MQALDIDHLTRAMAEMPVPVLQRVADAARKTLQQRKADVAIESQAGDGQPACPHCRKRDRIVRWGSSSGLQRWRCRDCGKTFNMLTGTRLGHVRQRAEFHEAARNMLSPHPLSCRKLARNLGVHWITVWRWRIQIIRSLAGFGDTGLTGLVEADETFVRESRKGSREWVRHWRIVWELADFIESGGHLEAREALFRLMDETAPKLPKPAQLTEIAAMCGFDSPHMTPPPRPRWRDFDRFKLKLPRGLSRWQEPILILRNRDKATSATHLGGLRHTHFMEPLDKALAPDAMLCTDSAAVYRRYCSKQGRALEQVNTRKGERVRDKVYHIQNANAFHSRFKAFYKPFRGPAKKYLPLYVGWMVFRDRTPDNFQGSPLMLRLLERLPPKDKMLGQAAAST